jgi:hypothetical protein
MGGGAADAGVTQRRSRADHMGPAQGERGEREAGERGEGER